MFLQLDVDDEDVDSEDFPEVHRNLEILCVRDYSPRLILAIAAPAVPT